MRGGKGDARETREAKVQKCQSAYGLGEGAKVDASFGWRVVAPGGG